MKRYCSTSLVLVVMACMAWLAPTAGRAEESTDDAIVKRIIEYFRAKNQVPASMPLQIKEPLQPSGKIAGAKTGVLSAGTNQVSFIVSNDGHYVVFGSEVKEFQPSLIKGAKTGSLNTGRQTTQVTISDDSTYAIVGEVEDLTVDPFAAVMKKISLKDVASKGPANAKVTIVEYSDYQCPFCSKGYEVIENQVLKEYGNKVRFIYKDFPLPMHPWAEPSAIATRCAQQQKPAAFWKLYDYYFQHQKEITAQNLKEKSLEALKGTGVDAAKFSDCLDNKKTLDIVKAGQTEGTAVGVNGTPAFIINGRLISGAQPYENFKTVIDDELARAAKK